MIELFIVLAFVGGAAWTAVVVRDKREKKEKETAAKLADNLLVHFPRLFHILTKYSWHALEPFDLHKPYIAARQALFSLYDEYFTHQSKNNIYATYKKPLTLREARDVHAHIETLINTLSDQLPDHAKRKEGEALVNGYFTRLEQFLDQLAHEPVHGSTRNYLGTTTDNDFPVLYLPTEDRFRHTYIIGKTGSGKSTLLEGLINRDSASGGRVIISPERGLFDRILTTFLGEESRQHVIYFDPTDTTPPIVGFNPFHFEEGEDLTQKAGETYTIFERALGDLGVKMTTLLQNSVYALLQRSHSTILDLEQLLDPRDDTLRLEIAHSPTIDERTRKFWASYNSSSYYKTAFEPVINRLDPFLRPPLSETLSVSSFSFHEILNTSEYAKTLCCDLSKLRGIQAEVVGQLLIAQIQQSFFRRDAMPEDARRPAFLYIDEFQTFAQTSAVSLIEMLNRLRKYNVGVTLAHQVTADIPSKLLSVLVGNAGTVVALQLAAEDAPFFARELQIKDNEGHTRPDFLQNLYVGQGYARTPSLNQALLFSFAQEPARPKELAEATRATSKKIYGVQKSHNGKDTPPEGGSTPPPEKPPTDDEDFKF